MLTDIVLDRSVQVWSIIIHEAARSYKLKIIGKVINTSNNSTSLVYLVPTGYSSPTPAFPSVVFFIYQPATSLVHAVPAWNQRGGRHTNICGFSFSYFS